MIAEFKIDSSRLTENFERMTTYAVPYYLTALKDKVKSKTPVDTGKLKNSWYVSGGTLANSQDYSGFVEYGTRYQKASLMLTLSVLESKDLWTNAIKRVWK